MSSKLSIAYDSIRSRDKAIEDLEGQIGALESDKYAALYFYEKAMKGREEWQGKAFAAEAEVAALKARIAELETENIVATEGKYARTEYMSYWTYDELLIRAETAEAELANYKQWHEQEQIRAVDAEHQRGELVGELIPALGLPDEECGDNAGEVILAAVAALRARAMKAEAERDKTAEQLERTVFGLIEWMKRAESAEKR